MSVTRADREASLKNDMPDAWQPHRKGEGWEEDRDRGLREAEDAPRARERP